jgi:DNA methylase
MITIRHGDCRDVLATMPDKSVHCCVTSPPYFGLRDYSTAAWEGGVDSSCNHVESKPSRTAASVASSTLGGGKDSIHLSHQFKGNCGHCGAVRVDKQIGLEATPDAFVAEMVAVFREVRRVLRDDGTLWLNLGDSYAGSWGAQSRGGTPSESSTLAGNGHVGGGPKLKSLSAIQIAAHPKMTRTGSVDKTPGLKPKDLIGIPWRVAFALQQPYYTGQIKDERDRIWLAAMIDAEGCIFVHKRHAGANHDSYERQDGTISQYVRQRDNYGAGLEISNTSEAIIQRCMEIVGRGSICSQGPEENARRKQTIFRWNMRSNECRDVIREVYPYLVAKQQQARIALGCPSTGQSASDAHQALIGLHNGSSTDVDFPEPASMYEPGFYLRQDIIWAKKNCMPESVTDRCTKSHEYIFLMRRRSETSPRAEPTQSHHLERPRKLTAILVVAEM